jgi:hypothetical protein
MAIQVVNNDKRPRSICPHCKKVMMVDLRPFQEDITKIIESKCPFCLGKIYSGLLIVSNTDLHRLAQHILQIVQMTKNANQLTT